MSNNAIRMFVDPRRDSDILCHRLEVRIAWKKPVELVVDSSCAKASGEGWTKGLPDAAADPEAICIGGFWRNRFFDVKRRNRRDTRLARVLSA